MGLGGIILFVVNRMLNKNILFILIFPLLFLANLFSCGLEELYYIAPVSEIEMVMTDSATIQLPQSGEEGYDNFLCFVIFYRIYTSGHLSAGKIGTSEERSDINPTLNSDFSAIYPSTDITNPNIDPNISLVTNRGYYRLALAKDGADIDIDKVLNRDSLSETLVISFPPNGTPVARINETEYTLYRSNGAGSFSPEPNRYFFNSEDLRNYTNAISTINADVAVQNNTQEPERYTYVSMYIAAMGNDKLYQFYSMPAFIGIFKLPEVN